MQLALLPALAKSSPCTQSSCGTPMRVEAAAMDSASVCSSACECSDVGHDTRTHPQVVNSNWTRHLHVVSSFCLYCAQRTQRRKPRPFEVGGAEQA